MSVTALRKKDTSVSLIKAVQYLERGFQIGRPEGKNLGEVWNPGLHPCDPQSGVECEVSQEVYTSLLQEPDYREFFCLFPGCGPTYGIARKDNEHMLKYEVTFTYVNRPNDPIQLHS